MYATLLEVALGLRYLHGQNIVHLDMKPHNVLLQSTSSDTRGFRALLTVSA